MQKIQLLYDWIFIIIHPYSTQHKNRPASRSKDWRPVWLASISNFQHLPTIRCTSKRLATGEHELCIHLLPCVWILPTCVPHGEYLAIVWMASIANVIHTVSPRSISERLKAIYTKKASPQLLHPILVAPLRDSGNLGIREVADLTNTTTRAFTRTSMRRHPWSKPRCNEPLRGLVYTLWH